MIEPAKKADKPVIFTKGVDFEMRIEATKLNMKRYLTSVNSQSFVYDLEKKNADDAANYIQVI